MNKKDVFKKAIVELVELGRRQGNLIGKEQINEILEPLDFDLDQKYLIEGYLKEQKIGIDNKLSPEDFMTKEDVDYLSIYLEALKNLREISDGEKQAITISSMAGEQNACNKFVEIYLPKVVEIAKLYVGEGAFIEDLIGEGNVALTIGSKTLGCLENLKEAEGFIGKLIMDAIEKYLESVESNASDMKKVLIKLNKILELSKKEMELSGRKITVEELLADSDFSKEEILEAISLSDELKKYIGEI
jgi:RNA polymerase primary sigma factor